MKIGRRKRTTIVRPNSRRKLVPWRNPHAPPAQAPVNVPAVMESDFLLMKTIPLRNHRGQIAHVPAVVAAVNALPVKVKVVDLRALSFRDLIHCQGLRVATLRVPRAVQPASGHVPVGCPQILRAPAVGKPRYLE